jgi:hypothetical protein
MNNTYPLAILFCNQEMMVRKILLKLTHQTIDPFGAKADAKVCPQGSGIETFEPSPILTNM